MGNGMGGLYSRRRNGTGPVLRTEPAKPKPRKSPAKKAATKAPATKKAAAKKSPAKKAAPRSRKSTAPKLAAQPGPESNPGGAPED